MVLHLMEVLMRSLIPLFPSVGIKLYLPCLKGKNRSCPKKGWYFKNGYIVKLL